MALTKEFVGLNLYTNSSNISPDTKSLSMKQLQMIWRLWAKALGEKAHKNDDVADKVAILRSFLFATYLITNCFIVAGVIRHWNEKNINVEVQIYENPNSNENTYPERRNNLGMGRDIRAESIYR
jgi:hypothetical protein